MRAEIRDLHARLKATMVYVTHDQVEAMTLADKIVVLRAGKVEQIGSPLELYNRPQNTFVAGFIGSPRMNFLPATLLPADVSQGAQTVGIRPEHAVIDATGKGALTLQIEQIEQLGASSLLLGKVSADTTFELVIAGQTQLKRGDAVSIALPGDSLHRFDTAGQRV
jgi:multiple sugar transport system ATP-binding protein